MAEFLLSHPAIYDQFRQFDTVIVYQICPSTRQEENLKIFIKVLTVSSFLLQKSYIFINSRCGNSELNLHGQSQAGRSCFSRRRPGKSGIISERAVPSEAEENSQKNREVRSLKLPYFPVFYICLSLKAMARLIHPSAVVPSPSPKPWGSPSNTWISASVPCSLILLIRSSIIR